ncbi:murein L,D-transpeptidase, partial [Lactobacillus sp. XV13L]|nr:murein L,D-transpeptidase [Lactobacillus sp. XV13L]
MQSRKNLKKYNKRNNLCLIIIGLVLILGVVFGVVMYNNHVEAQRQAREFATSHFNPNVRIYGVNVGKLTVNKATAKINSRANNIVVLESGKVTIERDPDTATIDRQTTATYFKKQHTAMPDNRDYEYRNTALDAANKKLHAVSHAVTTYNVAGKSYKLKAQPLINKAVFKKGKYSFINVENLTAKLNKIDKDVTTIHKSFKFAVPVGNKLHARKITV